MISPKHRYVAEGSALIEHITRLPRYYTTSTEGELMKTHGWHICGRIAAAATVIELGAGDGKENFPNASTTPISSRRFAGRILASGSPSFWPESESVFWSAA